MIGMMVEVATVIPALTWIERTYGDPGHAIFAIRIGIAIASIVLVILSLGGSKRIKLLTRRTETSEREGVKGHLFLSRSNTRIEEEIQKA